MIAWIKGYARGMTLLVLLAAVAAVATGFSGSPQVSGQSFTPPTDVQATSSGDTITVSWSPGSGASSQVIVAVNVLDDTDYCLGFDATGSASSHECPGLTNGETYVVLVIALDGAGGYRLGRDAQGDLVTHTLLSVPVSQEVGAGEAATVTHDSGAQLEVPAGALPEATTVSIAEVQPPASDIPVGRVYDFSVGEVELTQPVTLRIPYELPAGGPTELLYAVHWNEDAGEWERIEAEVDETTGVIVVTTAELSRFSSLLVSVDATCSVEPDDDTPGKYVISSTITSRTLFDISVYLAPEVHEPSRNATYDRQSELRSDVHTLSNGETAVTSATFRTLYPGIYQARCRVFWQLRDPLGITNSEHELNANDYRFADFELAKNVAPDRDLSQLNECSSSSGVDPATGKTKRNFGKAHTALVGESLAFTANGFAGEGSMDLLKTTPRNTPHLVAAIAAYQDGTLLKADYGEARPAYTVISKPERALATISLTFPKVGEYTVDCALWWFLADPKIPDFENEAEESIKDLLRCIRDGASCIGYLNALRDVRTVTVNAVVALWSDDPIEIEPARLPQDSPDSRVTVKVYTRESPVAGPSVTPPTVVLTLRENLGLTALPSKHRQIAESCAMRGSENCWQASFVMPRNPANAEVDAAGNVVANDLVYDVSVVVDREISGMSPTGTLSVLSESPFSSDRDILKIFYDATSGPDWTKQAGWTTATVDVGDWDGVDVDGANRVIRLVLPLNNLFGKIPAVLGLLDALEHLDLSGNARFHDGLRGEIPSALGNLGKLTSLDLSNNTLRGEIPATLGNLANLEGLDLSDNDLEGEIPATLGNLANLEGLDLSDNDLEGEIPATLGNLANLEGLDLSDNDLEGEIPATLGNLANLEDISLSGNSLTGCIPAGLRDLRDDDFDEMDLPYCDVALTGLTTYPGELQPAFEPQVMRYTATVSAPQVSIIPVSEHNATFEFQVGSSRNIAPDADTALPEHQVNLPCGETVVRVEVISADGEEYDTYTIDFTRGGVGLPAAPTIHSVSGGTGSLTVSWNAPDTACSGTIDRYNLRYSLDQDDATWTEVRGPSGSLSHTIRGLTAGTTYRVQVQAVNEHGAGPWSESATGTPRQRSMTQRPPSQPQQGTGITADYTVNEGDGTVSLSIPVVASPPGAEIQRVNISTRADSPNRFDYDSYNESFTFDSDAPATISVPIQIHDNLSTEPTERFFIDVEVTTATETTQTTFTVAILDDDLVYVEFSRSEYPITENRTLVILVQVSYPRITCPFEGNLYVDLSFSDPNNALTEPAPSSLTFIRCQLRNAFQLSLGDVSGDVQVIVTITDVRTDNAELNSRVLPGDQSSVTINVMDISRR